MRHLIICITSLALIFTAACTPPFSSISTHKKMIATDFDWQGHRGARGLLPENTIPAFLKALDLGVRTLELDLAVSADAQLILSHEPWLSHEICSKADGTPIKKDEENSFLIYKMTAADIAKCDCGSRGSPRFPRQEKIKTHKPTLPELVEAVKKYCTEKNRTLPRFNIEIKSQPDYDEKKTPSVSTFAKLAVEALKVLKIKELSTIQSFDPRALEAVKKLDPSVSSVLLVENLMSLEKNLARLTFKPDVYSPYFKLLGKKTVDSCHAKGIKVVPWTVNDTTDMRNLINLGVDGIITDYPDLIIR